MKRTFLCAAFFGLASVAQAADLAPAYKSAPAALSYNWTGFYLGANAGYGWGNGSVNGALGGGQLGYNWQTGNFVWGLETDFQVTGQKASATATALGVTVTETDKVSWLGSTRLRAGFASDRWFFYGTGGFAYGKVKIDGAATGLVAGPYSASNTLTGWTVGTGVEAAINKSWTWKVEYLYVSLGSFSNTYVVPPATIPVNYARVTDSIVRVGLNYKF